MNIVSKFSIALTALFLCLLAPTGSLALTPRRLSIQVIRATQDAGPVDPRLGALPRDREPFVRYRSFELALEASLELSPDRGRVTQALPNGDTLILESEGASDPRIVIRVRIEHEGAVVLDARVRRRPDEGMFYVGGRAWGNSAMIIGIHPHL